MMYYRIAGRLRQAPTWRWRTTKLTSLSAVLTHLQYYRWPEHTELRVFFASSVAGLEEMLSCANEGELSASVPAEQICCGQPMPRWELAGEEEASEKRKLALPGRPSAWASTTPTRSGTSLDGLGLRRLELEVGTGGDHDRPYTFAWPDSLPQALAWIRLMSRVRQGGVAP